ncbi:hypothetical protein MCAMS1_02202 [biofilm metagenome]
MIPVNQENIFTIQRSSQQFDFLSHFEQWDDCTDAGGIPSGAQGATQYPRGTCDL